MWKNPNKSKEYQHERWLRDKNKLIVLRKKYNMAHPDLLKQQKAQDYIKHIEKRKATVKQYQKENWATIKETKRKYRQSPKGRLNTYIKSAKVRGYEFNLSSEDFNEIIFSNCHYCGKPSANGVDRKDSAIGYYTDNVVPCCSTCNYMKRDLSYEDFKNHIKKIVSNFLSSSQ